MALSENPNFSTTNWSVVLAAAQSDPAASALALEKLCKRYWHPVYAFVRRRGHEVHEAEDLTQGFFYFVIEQQALLRVDQAKGRFRTFILTALTNFLHNERDRHQAYKRGGRHQIISLDDEFAESTLGFEERNGETPEILFERHWATMMVKRALEELRCDYEERGKGALFANLQPFLTGEPVAADHERIARQLSMEAGTVKVALHRARRRFGEILRREVAHTVERPDEIEAEIRDLLAAMAN